MTDTPTEETPKKRESAFPPKPTNNRGRNIALGFLGFVALSGVWSYWVSQPDELYPPKYVAQGHEVIDLANNIVWLRCVGGMQWNGKTCIGRPQSVTHAQALKIIPIARQQLQEQGWRLPTRGELLSTTCPDCIGIKTYEKYFPNTPLGSQWTNQKNTVNPRYYWSVNFMTGHSYGRYAPSQEMYIRLVKNR